MKRRRRILWVVYYSIISFGICISTTLGLLSCSHHSASSAYFIVSQTELLYNGPLLAAWQAVSVSGHLRSVQPTSPPSQCVTVFLSQCVMNDRAADVFGVNGQAWTWSEWEEKTNNHFHNYFYFESHTMILVRELQYQP